VTIDDLSQFAEAAVSLSHDSHCRSLRPTTRPNNRYYALSYTFMPCFSVYLFLRFRKVYFCVLWDFL